jgi:hypothetical protein
LQNEFKKLGENSGVYPPVTWQAEIGKIIVLDELKQ